MNWPRATAERSGGCAFVVVLAALIPLASLWPNGAFAGDRSDEVPIGTFKLNPPPAAAGPHKQVHSELDETDETIEGLFEDAVAALGDGRAEQAQRLFEQLIAESPDSALAGKARAHLADLYRAGPLNTVANRNDTGAAQPRSDLNQKAAADRVGEPAGRAISAALEEQFIASAGDRVFFSVGSAELGSRARSVLQAQARFIKLRPNLEAQIEGHADDAPLSPEEHARLSEARAEAVRQRLISEGIESHRLAITAWGRERRVSECPDPACAAQNRRAVTVLLVAPTRRTGRPDNPPSSGADTVVAREPAVLTH